MKIGGAILAAASVPALLVLLFGNWVWALGALVIALAHAVLLGLPLFLFARSRGWPIGPFAPVFGFIIGAYPISFLQQYPDWVVVLIFGACGAAGGVAFWAVLKLAGELSLRPSDGVPEPAEPVAEASRPGTQGFRRPSS